MFQFKTDTDLFTFLKDKCTVLNIVISGDGKYFATTATDRKVRLCSVHTHTHTYTWTRSFESEEIVPYHFSDINWAQGQNMSHLINCQCINGCLKTLGSKLKLVSCF